MRLVIVGGIMAFFLLGDSFAADVGFIEEFALAKDRANALKQLIPGTEDYYYYHCLHALNTEQFDKVEPFARPWLERFGQTPRYVEIQARHALLTYDRNPKKSLDFLQNQLGLQFNHQREVVGAAPNLPTSLDPKLISRETLKARSLSNWSNLENFEDASLEWLASSELGWERRRNLLQRLTRPDVPNLVKLIVEDLSANNAPPFGSYPIHSQLTLAQLDELVALRPATLNEPNYVQTYIAKLQPNADEEWRRNPAVAEAYFDRLLKFTDRLAPVHNSLKAHVLYHRLVLDRNKGVYNRERFIAYLKLPRRQGYMPRAMLESQASRNFPADLNADFSRLTFCPPIFSDEQLVRDYLKHFLVDASSPREFEPYIDGNYLRIVFAEAKIENGLGDPEQWASQLSPEMFRQLKDRIDIDFAFTNKTDFAVDEPVKLDLFVKNVPSLLVKVFEVNTGNIYRSTLKEIDTDINLDGLVANSESSYPYTDPPLRRISRKFEFPQINKPGVYIIDFIGAGKSSRALIRKGRLYPLVKNGPAGQVISVVNDARQLVTDASVWLGGQEYKPDADGKITVPYSTQPGRRPIVISRGDFSSLDAIEHRPENYRLDAGIYVDREALLATRIATIVIRPGLFINNTPTSLKLLDEALLRVTSTDLDGIATAVEVPKVQLFEDRETTYEIRVPSRLASLSVTLEGKVKSLSRAQPVSLSANETFTLNGIDQTDFIEDLHFARFGSDFVIDLLGRSGEPRPDRPVQLALKHKDFKEPVQATVKTDARGRVMLGTLTDIVSITATGPEGTAHTWTPPTDRHSYRQVLQAKVGETCTVPYLGKANEPKRDELALFEVRGNLIRADRFEALGIRNGLIELKGLSAGDYDLWLKTSGDRIRVRVTEGPDRAGFLIGANRHLETAPLKPVQIRSIEPDADGLTIRLTDASKFARVHIFGVRYRPAYSAFANLGKVRDAELGGLIPARAESVYLTGRNIGDEYRYVLDRRGQKKFAGNMLDRPSLLLNPWAIRTTDTGEQLAEGGQAFGATGAAAPAAPVPTPAPKMAADPARQVPAGEFADLDFLADAAAVLLNLVPDQDGVIRIAKKDLGAHSHITVVAVDPLSTTSRSISLPETPARFFDMRLASGLDPSKHFTQQKQVSIIAAGESFEVKDVAGSRFEAYDSLPRVYRLYATLTKDAKLLEFSFLMNWPQLSAEEKRANYSKYACHELNFFIYQKDQPFFRDVVKPYLANKKDKTFLDHWLLSDDLNEYLQPWKYNRLNSVERILLAQRINGEAAKTSRNLTDLFRLLPPNPDRTRYLFETSVQSSALSSGKGEGATDRFQREKNLADNKAQLALPKRDEAAASPPLPTGATAAGAPGPAGGFGGGMPPGAGGGGGRGSIPGKPAQKGAAKPGDRPMEARPDSANMAKDGRATGGEAETERVRRSAGEGLGELQKDADKFFDDAGGKRKEIRQLFRRVEPTQEWAENNYYHLLIQQQLYDLVPTSEFWIDYSKHDGKSPFLSRHFADASRNFAEMVMALAVLDLPFEAKKHDVKFEKGGMTMKAASSVIAVHEEVRSAEGPDAKLPVLISQNFYRLNDRYREEGGERFDKFVTGEFVVHTVYGCQLVVTNPSSSRQKLSVLIQLPVGAIPVGNGKFTKSIPIDLEPYRTQTIDYHFYFPLPGKFAQFPAHVGKGDKYVAAASPASFDVVATPSKLDTTSWDYVSQNGSEEEVLKFLDRENVAALNLDRIAFRMKDRGFFEAVTKLLAARHIYNPTLWSYGIVHGDVGAIRQFIAHSDPFVAQLGGPIESPLFKNDPVERYAYEHLEYKPLVNSRAHSLGRQRQIVNSAFHAQYHKMLGLISCRNSLTDADRLAVTYYLLLQDRVEEGMAMFASVNPEKVPSRLQYDYCAAYLKMSGDEPQQARAIVAKYASYPVDRWRNLFANVGSQLDEIEGKPGKINELDDRDQRQQQLAATEPGFTAVMEGNKVNLVWQNLKSVRVNYYLMDVELLFSRNPFVQQSGNQFSWIKPNASRDVELAAGQNRMTIPIPEEFSRRNVLIEITGAGKSQAIPFYSNAMDVRLLENYGQLRVTESASGKPLAKVYVKTYVKLSDGTIKFHKDGYTDHRGRFDYASVSTPEKLPPSRYSVLILSEDRGATIREAAPPSQ